MIDLPLLQSVKLGNYSFKNAESIELSNLTSLQSIDFGQGCFGGHSEQYYNNRYYQIYKGGAPSFTLKGIYNSK